MVIALRELNRFKAARAGERVAAVARRRADAELGLSDEQQDFVEAIRDFADARSCTCPSDRPPTPTRWRAAWPSSAGTA